MKENPVKPVVIYRRVSTSEQGKSGLGLEAQASAMTRFCAAEGFEGPPVRFVRKPATSTKSYTGRVVRVGIASGFRSVG